MSMGYLDGTCGLFPPGECYTPHEFCDFPASSCPISDLMGQSRSSFLPIRRCNSLDTWTAMGCRDDLEESVMLLSTRSPASKVIHLIKSG